MNKNEFQSSFKVIKNPIESITYNESIIEWELDQGHVGCVAKSVTLGNLLNRYLKEVTPHKKSRDKET